MQTMELIQLPSRPADWDERIGYFDSKTLFHESAWLDFALSCHPRSRVAYYRIMRSGKEVGYFCAFVKRRALFRLCEIPFPGRMHFGPIVNADVDSAELVEALLTLFRRDKMADLVLYHKPLSSGTMRKLGLTAFSNVIHFACPLDGGIDAVWTRMKGTCRTRIRKAAKMGMIAEVTDSDVFAENFFRLFSTVLSHKGLKVPYGLDVACRLLQHLLPSDRVFPVWVKRDGEVIGAALYPHDNRAMYFWEGASEPESLHLSPNELLHWTAIKLAVDRGIRVFNMSGGPDLRGPSRFTTKFGGELQQITVYRKSLLPFLTPARRVYSWLRFVRGGIPLDRLAAL